VPDTLKVFHRMESKWKEGLKQTEFKFIKWIIDHKEYSLFANKIPRRNWIKETLKESKTINKFKECKNLIMVGSGIYPYSMIDLYKEYPNINQIGLDYDANCVKLSTFLLQQVNINIKIICINGIDYDYSMLDHEDLVFISIDVEDIDKIFNKILSTSKAQPYICAPYKHAWIKNTFGNHLLKK